MPELDSKFSEILSSIRQQNAARGYASMEELYGMISGMIEVASREISIPSSSMRCHMMMWMVKELVKQNNEPELFNLLSMIGQWTTPDRSLAMH